MEIFDYTDYDGHRDRLRKRIESGGVESLKNYELLEFLLCQAMPRQDMSELARNLINHFGDLHAMLGATDEQLCQAGVYEGAMEFISVFFDCARAILNLSSKNAVYAKNIRDVYRRITVLREKITGPCCYQLCTDRFGRLSHEAKICSGTQWAGKKSLALAMEYALATNAATVIILIFGGSTPNVCRQYDIENARLYGSVLKSANGALVDILYANSRGVTSMRSANVLDKSLIPPKLDLVCEEYIRSLPSGGKNASIESV